MNGNYRSEFNFFSIFFAQNLPKTNIRNMQFFVFLERNVIKFICTRQPEQKEQVEWPKEISNIQLIRATA